MTTASPMNETELQTRLRRAKEVVESNRNRQQELLKQLAECAESIRIAKSRYEDLFHAEEQAEVTRRRNEYRHSTH